MSVHVYVEGGGNTKSLRTECRRAFAEFFRNAGLQGRLPRVTACGSRNDAFDDFCSAVRAKGDTTLVLLLVDSEAHVDLPPNSLPTDQTVWSHLKQRDGWDRPSQIGDGQAHLMVQCMESWFLADVDVLHQFFGPGFHHGSLPNERNVEKIPKNSVLGALKTSTRLTKTKGEYSKGRHAFKILALVDPSRIEKAAPHAALLLNTLRRTPE